MKAQELHNQSVPELEALSIDLNKRLFDLNNKRKGLKEHKVAGEYRNTRKDIARVQTILTQKKGMR